MMNSLYVATLGSHSALEICRGAKDEGFKTLVIAQKGREKTYREYYKSQKDLGCVDECIVVNKFSDILKKVIQQKLIKKKCIFVPHRSFEAYLGFDYEAIEKKFRVPMFGNKFLLKIEERGITPNQYTLLQAAKIRFPLHFPDPSDIDRLSMVKVLEKTREFERAFFLVNSYSDYKKQVKEKLSQGIFTKDQLGNAVVEEYVVGVQVNLNYFYSPIKRRLELMGTDTRRQTNFEGVTRIPAKYQYKVIDSLGVSYEEAGHIAVTILESMLEEVFAIGERFVLASQKLMPPGIIGPFALQCIMVPGPPKKEFIVIDVSPRMPGSPGISTTPYASYLYGNSMSMGERIAKELKEAIISNQIDIITT